MNNLAEVVLSHGREAVEICWRPGVVAFSCDGRPMEAD